MTPGLVDRLDLAVPWALALIPVVLLLGHLSRKRGRRLVGFSSVGLTEGLPTTLRTRLALLPSALVTLGCVLAVVAVARPRLGDERTVSRSEGIGIEMVVDVSGSMRALDFTDHDGSPINRLGAVKAVVREFVDGGGGLPGRAGDAIGLTTFAGYADALCPLTLDHRLLLDTLDATDTARAEFEDGTSIGQGLAVALGRLREHEAASKIVVLLTDGVNNDPENDPLAAAAVASELGVRVYTIGIGTQGFAPYPKVGPNGETEYVRVPVRIDEALLEAIAAATGGKYGRAGSTEDLRDLYIEIDRLERTELEGLTYKRWRELFPWPLAGGAALWVLALLLETTWLRRLG